MVLSDSRERRGKSSQWGFLRAWNTWELLTFSVLKFFFPRAAFCPRTAAFCYPQGNGNSGRSWKHLMSVWRVGELHSWWAGLCFSSLTLIEQNSPSAGAVNSATGIQIFVTLEQQVLLFLHCFEAQDCGCWQTALQEHNRCFFFFTLRLKITSQSGGTWAWTRRELLISLCQRLIQVRTPRLSLCQGFFSACWIKSVFRALWGLAWGSSGRFLWLLRAFFPSFFCRHASHARRWDLPEVQGRPGPTLERNWACYQSSW